VLSSFLMVLVEIAIGATAATPLVSEMSFTSDRERLLRSKELEEVNSSIMFVTESFEELGRTTIRSAPISETSDLMRFEILPVKERIRIILAIPIAIPRQVKKERVRFSRIEFLASLRWVLKSRAISVSSG